MTVPWYQEVLQIVGVDVLLTGALFVLAILIASRLVKPGSPFSAFAAGWQDFCQFFGLDTQAKSHQAPDKETGDGAGVLATVKAVGSGAAVLFLAAGAGMVIDAVAHRVLDNNLGQLAAAAFQGEKSEAKENKAEHHKSDGKEKGFLHAIKFSWPEDEIKRTVFHDIGKRWTGSVPCGKQEQAAKDCERDQEEWQAKDLYQEAHLRILDSSKQDIKSTIAREELFMKVFRVVFVLSCLLALVTLCKVGMRETWGQRLIMVVLLVGASALLLYLWSQESRHYYRKVYHAYEIVFPGASATAFIPSDTYYEENKDAATILQAIVKLQDQGKDDSDWQAALAAPGGDTLLRFDFYRCMLKTCKDPDWKAPALTAKQRNAWLLHWRNSLNATSALDARTAGLIAVAERYSFPNQPNQPSGGESKKAKKDRKLNDGGESLSAASGASKR